MSSIFIQAHIPLLSMDKQFQSDHSLAVPDLTIKPIFFRLQNHECKTRITRQTVETQLQKNDFLVSQRENL